MTEKEKRKEKPKRSNRPFVWLSVLMVLVFLVGIGGIVSYVFRETWCPPDCFMSQSTPLFMTSETALTQISASATAAIANATATEAAK